MSHHFVTLMDILKSEVVICKNPKRQGEDLEMSLIEPFVPHRGDMQVGVI